MIQSIRLNKTPFVLTLTYLLFVLFSAILFWTYNNPLGGLGGVFLMMTTLPWSFLLAVLIKVINPILLDNNLAGILIFGAGTIANALILSNSQYGIKRDKIICQGER